jgi:4-diphosphocytidyl-2-C-methyl-D-erythritol kinase
VPETAYAKINLALHVRRRRADGYHGLETLFAFVDAGDELTARRSERDELKVVGEFAGQLFENPSPAGRGRGWGSEAKPSVHVGAEHPHPDPPPPGGGSFLFGNLVSKALAKLPRPDGLSIVLEKNLPVAAGLGGGSADAGAVFRLVREAHGLPEDWRQRAASLGADVPACVESVACIGRGTGTELELVENDLAECPVLLVNPRVPLATGPVFAAWDGEDRGPLPEGPASRIAFEGRNDLEAPAIALCPPVGDVLASLRATGAELVRMSGSGATCFALDRRSGVIEEAAERIARNHPEWWQLTGKLR